MDDLKEEINGKAKKGEEVTGEKAGNILKMPVKRRLTPEEIKKNLDEVGKEVQNSLSKLEVKNIPDENSSVLADLLDKKYQELMKMRYSGEGDKAEKAPLVILSGNPLAVKLTNAFFNLMAIAVMEVVGELKGEQLTKLAMEIPEVKNGKEPEKS